MASVTASTNPSLDRVKKAPRGWRALLGGGSLRRRMISIAALWIFVLLVGGGVALDRVLTNAITQNFDDGQQYVLTSMIAAAEIGPDGEVLLNRPLGDQRFLEPYSGFYWQINGDGFDAFRSRSLWDRALKYNPKDKFSELHVFDNKEFDDDVLRVVSKHAADIGDRA